MIETGLTDFVDFLATNGTTRAAKVRALIERPDYHPALDYYKPGREAIVRTLSAGRSLGEAADAVLAAASNGKEGNYALVAAGLRRLASRSEWRNADWFDPPSSEWSYRNLLIRVRPELGLMLNGRRLAIKLYFKEDPLARRIAWVANHLMEETFSPTDREKCGTLDTRHGILISGCGKSRDLRATLRGEADAFIGMYQSLAAA